MRKICFLAVLLLSSGYVRLSAQSVCGFILATAPATENQGVCSNGAISLISYFSLDTSPVTVTGLPAGITYTYSTAAGYSTLSISGSVAATAGTYSYTVSRGCNPVVASGTITINPTPVVTATPSSQSICSGSAIAPVVLTGSVSRTTFNWSRDNTSTVTGISSNGIGNISGTLTNLQNAIPTTVTFTVIPMANGCQGPAVTLTVVVKPLPVASALPASQSPCSGTAISPVALSGSLSSTTFSWSRDNAATATGISASGTGNISGTLTNTTSGVIPVTFTVTPTANGCPGTATTAIVQLFPRPNAVATPDSQGVCSGSFITTISFTGAVSGTTYDWLRDNLGSVTGIDGGGAGNFISSKLTSTGYSPEPVVFTVTPTANGCQGIPITTKVLVLPRPNAIATPPSQAVCSDVNIDSIISYGYVPGTTFNWIRGGLVTANVGGTIALAGSGNVGGSLTNTTTIPITVTFTITPTANSCMGGATTSTVRIDPVPNAVATPASQTICSGVAVNNIVLSGNVAGTLFNWTRNNTVTVTGIGASGTGNINGALINSSNAPITVTFTITPLANGCPGTPITATVLVNPTPNAVATPATQTVCSGVAIIAITNSSSVAGTTFSWTRNSSLAATGIGVSGNGSISGTLTNTTDTPARVTFTITPTTATCPGLPTSATVLVNATPNAVATPAAQTICSGSAINAITDSGRVAGTTFTWTRNNTAIVTGINASGSGNTSGVLTNTNNAPVMVTFTITPAANGCSGIPITASVLVNPMPNAAAAPLTQTVCSGIPINTIVLSGNVSSTTYNWTRDNSATITGILATSSGNIGGTLVNTTKAPLMVTFTITPVANNCSGIPTSATILVNPPPVVVVIPALQSKCSGAAIDSIRFSSSVSGVVLNWTRNNLHVTGIDSSGQDVIAGSLTNKLDYPATVTFFITPTANNCPGLPVTADVLVYPTPTIDVISDHIRPNQANYTYCNRNNAQGFYFTSITPDSAFTWTGSENIGFGTNGNGNVPAFIAKNTTSLPIVDTITVNVIASIRRCAGPSRTFTITVNPSPSRPDFKSLSLYADTDTLRLCSGADNINFNINTSSAGVSYLWNAGIQSDVSIKAPNDPNTVISFPNVAGVYTINVKATSGKSCTDSVTQTVIVSANPGIDKRSIFLKQPGNILIYPDNSLDQVKGYQWGYDSVLENTAYTSPIRVPGQVYQYFIPDRRFLNSDNQLDTLRRAFWVLLEKGTCNTRVYYNGAYRSRSAWTPPEDNTVQLTVIPNPNEGYFNISLEGNIYGSMHTVIYNALGQIVFNTDFTKATSVFVRQFKTNHLPDGLYYLEIRSSDLKKVQTRFIIHR